MSICKAKVQDHNMEMLEDEIVTLDFRNKLLVWTWSFQNIDTFSSENNTKFVAKELSSQVDVYDVLTLSLHHYSLRTYVNRTTKPWDNVELLLNHLIKKFETFCQLPTLLLCKLIVLAIGVLIKLVQTSKVFYIIYEGTLALSHCDLECDVLFERLHGSIKI